MSKLIFTLICLSAFGGAIPCQAKIITVDDDTPADFNNIQAGIDDANNGDTIEIQPGRYTGQGNRDIDFKGKAITVRSTDPNDPNIVTTTVIDCNGSEAQPHRGFYFHSSEGPDSILSGITITNGYGPYKEIYTYMRSVGGAIYLEGSSPTIRNCFVTGNSAYAYGGAIYCVSSNPLIRECVISRNISESGSGGAIYCEDSSPSIIECNIAGNSSDGSGGGINSHNSSPKIFNCSITGNSAINGGGFACYNGSPIISHCKIMNNSATYSAGGIRCSYFSSMSIDNCIITGNIAHSGGGIYVWQASADITHCTVANNSAEHGGGIYCGASQSIVTMSHCILWNNKSNSGAQVMLSYSSEPSHFTISHSDVQGGQANVSVELGWILNWSKSNIDFDPLFVDTSECNYHLSAHSICIDAGDPAYVVLPEETDIDGGPRVLGIRTDMGADESTDATETPVIGFSPAKFVLYSYAGGPSPKDQTLFIRNTGIRTLTWQIGEDCSWIELCPANGQSVDEIDEVTVSINTTGSSVGSYLCELKIIGEGASNSPQVVPINVHVANRELHVPSEYPTIQAAIDAAVADGQTVIVADNIYTGEGNRDIDFKGKSITVRSESGPENCIIDCQKLGGGFFFHSGETANSIIDGFTITNSWWSGISCRESSPTISNCNISNCSADHGGGIECRDNSCATITNCNIIGNIAGHGGGIACGQGSNVTINNCSIIGNLGGDAAGGIWCTYSTIALTNCSVIGNVGVQNGGGVSCQESVLTATNCTFADNSASKGNFLGCIFKDNAPSHVNISNCIIRNGGDEIWNENRSVIVINYSNIQNGWFGVRNIDADPCFVQLGYWDPNGTPEHPNDDFWVDGDYHLKSQAGRWDANKERWTKDDVMSPCIDAGDPASPIGLEPFPNGGIINMGAYGGTREASKSYFGEPVCETIIAGDTNGDCKVDFRDFALMAFHWLEEIR